MNAIQSEVLTTFVTHSPGSVDVDQIHSAFIAISVNPDTGISPTVSSVHVMGTLIFATLLLDTALTAEIIPLEQLVTGDWACFKINPKEKMLYDFGFITNVFLHY